MRGYTAETFVDSVYFITHEFDVRFDRIPSRFPSLKPLFFVINPFIMFFHAVTRYRILYLYFDGGCLYNTILLWRVEPQLYHTARVSLVLMPYGGDIQDLTRCPNLFFRHVYSRSYPGQRLRRNLVADRIDLWTRYADHLISGCDWVDYLYYWDTLTLGHFSIDLDKWQPPKRVGRDEKDTPGSPLKVLHAPNHRDIKGTEFFVSATEELRAEGYPIELIIREKIPNTELRKLMESVDVVADQLVIGWYAMFALEAMALEKPVICYIREDLERLYIDAGLLLPGELPLVRAGPKTVKDVLRHLCTHREELPLIGRRSREFVSKHHSLEFIGNLFDSVNRMLGVNPANPIVPACYEEQVCNGSDTPCKKPI